MHNSVGERQTDGPADPRRRVAMNLATCLFYLESEAEKASLSELARTIHDVAVKAAVVASDA